MKAWEDLRGTVVQLLEWKKNEDLLENSVKVLRIRREQMNVLGSPTSPIDMGGKVSLSRIIIARTNSDAIVLLSQGQYRPGGGGSSSHKRKK
jgi:hypothetical protein